MLIGKPSDLFAGGTCVFQLPPDPSCASPARSLVTGVMREPALSRELIEDAELAVSELATNRLDR